MNVIAISGRLTALPELKKTPSGKSVCSFSLAVDRPRVKDITDFFTVVAWEHTAEYISKYAGRGDTVEVNGILTTRSYEDRSGAKRTVIEIKADEARIVHRQVRQAESTEASATVSNAPSQTSFENFAKALNDHADDDDLPF